MAGQTKDYEGTRQDRQKKYEGKQAGQTKNDEETWQDRQKL